MAKTMDPVLPILPIFGSRPLFWALLEVQVLLFGEELEVNGPSESQRGGTS